MNKLLKKFALSTNNSVTENALACAAIALTSSFLYYEQYFAFFKYIKAAAAVLVFLVWAYCAISSGKNKKYGFLIFAGLYWAVPYFYMMFYRMRDNLHHYSKWLAQINRCCDTWFSSSFGFVAEKLNCSTEILVLMLVIITASMFFIGKNIHSIYIEKVNRGEYDEEQDDSSIYD